MEEGKVTFNYFYQIFQKEFYNNIVQINSRKISNEEEKSDDIFAYFGSALITKEEQISLYNQILFNICTDYVTLSNSTISIYPTDTLEFVDLILDTIQENPYKESFLFSLQFIYQNYFDCLEKGSPILKVSQDASSLSSLQVVLDSQYQIIDFDAINMDMIEQDKIMTKLLSMEMKNQIGPIPKILYRIRQDL